jgi:hypothetical protein
MRRRSLEITIFALAIVTLLGTVSSFAATAVRCYTYRINYPSGEKRCGVHCEDKTEYHMDCDADIFDDGFDQEYPLERLGSPVDDQMTTTAEPEYIDAMAGNDVLIADDGDDWLEGGEGDDELTGGPGDDYLFGGYGNDQYYYKPGDGNDLIVDPVGANRLTLAAELSPSVVMIPDGPDLVIEITAPGAEASILILNYFTYLNFTIDYGSPVFF